MPSRSSNPPSSGIRQQAAADATDPNEIPASEKSMSASHVVDELDDDVTPDDYPQSAKSISVKIPTVKSMSVKDPTVKKHKREEPERDKRERRERCVGIAFS